MAMVDYRDEEPGEPVEPCPWRTPAAIAFGAGFSRDRARTRTSLHGIYIARLLRHVNSKHGAASPPAFFNRPVPQDRNVGLE